MPATFQEITKILQAQPDVWLVTGAAGFIGSNLVEFLLNNDQYVVGLDNFSTGRIDNLVEVQTSVGGRRWDNFVMVNGDIRDLDVCRRALTWKPSGGHGKAVRFVLHQAALGSVPRSVADPISTNQSNVDGFLNMLVAARDSSVQRFVYAASSSTYGDHPELPKTEAKIGKPLSPYAVTKLVNELYADVFYRVYRLPTIGLRYFNVFGRRQSPFGAYAAVIPKWLEAMLKGEQVYINGDGETSRDFCYVENAIQANVLAATVRNEAALGEVYNVAVGDRTSLNRLYSCLCENFCQYFPDHQPPRPMYRDFREGDVRHSLADIAKAQRLLGYRPSHRIEDGLREAVSWYVQEFSRRSGRDK